MFCFSSARHGAAHLGPWLVVAALGLATSPARAGEWIVDANTGCQVWNSNPAPGESIAWSGACPNKSAEGNGILRWYLDEKPNGLYDGEYRDGRMTGKGSYAEPNGNRYEGDYIDGKRHGRGIYTWKNGSRFDGARYDGEFRNDVIHGKGTYTFADGSRYEGSFIDGKKQGYGEEHQKNAAAMRGMWVAGKLERPCDSDTACVEMRKSSDPEFAKRYAAEQYKLAFASAMKSSDLRSFISTYERNDPDGLVPQAKKKLVVAERNDYLEGFRNAQSSSELQSFISTYKGKDPDKLVPKAEAKKVAALDREKKEYDKQQREEAYRREHACDHLYVGKVVDAPLSGLVTLFGISSTRAIVLGISQRNGVATVREVNNSSMVGELSCTSLH